MYDGLTARYTLACPERGEVSLRLSAFRTFERLPGAAHPAVYRVSFSCPCGETHPALVTHDELDWAPLGVSRARFYNLMTSRLEPAIVELLDQAARRIGAGRWPWSFFCFPEERTRQTFPSSFRLLAPQHDCVALAVRCPACARTSVNLCTHEHVDVPFFSDPQVEVVEHVFSAEEGGVAELRAELSARRLIARSRRLAA